MLNAIDINIKPLMLKSGVCFFAPDFGEQFNFDIYTPVAMTYRQFVMSLRFDMFFGYNVTLCQ